MSKRLTSFRKGDIRESITISFLRCIGFVAPIPREEDVGLDVVITLNEEQGRLSYPKETIGIQIKGSKSSPLYYGREELQYIHSLPFSVFFVTRDDGIIKIYSTSRLWVNTPNMKTNRPIWLNLNPSPKLWGDSEIHSIPCKNEMHNGIKTGALKERKEAPFASFFLGAPILGISESELETNQDYRKKITDIFLSHVRLENKAKILHELGTAGFISWKTNHYPSMKLANGSGIKLEKSESSMRKDIVVSALQLIDNSFSANIKDDIDEIPEHLVGFGNVMQWLKENYSDELINNTGRRINNLKK